jgi:hypothetical protein
LRIAITPCYNQEIEEMLQRPSAVGLFLCEQVITEKGTDNVTVVNSFSRRAVRRVLSRPFPFVVFALPTDGLGEVELEVTINRLDNLDEVYRAGTTFRFPDPLHAYRCKLRIQDCSFPVAGDYEVNLHAGGEVIARRKLSIVQRSQPS